MKKNSLIFIFCLLLFNNCKKNDLDALPPATQNGANTFGCLINGSVWVATGGKYLGNGYKLKPIEGGGYQYNYFDTLRNNVLLTATRGSDGNTVEIYLRNVNKPGIYNMTIFMGTHPASIVPFNYGSFSNTKNLYVTNVNHIGKVNITKADTVNNAVAGTFEFIGYDYNTKTTINITNGRFDFLYKP